MGRHLPYRITQCYLPPDTSEHTPHRGITTARQDGTRFTYLGGWIYKVVGYRTYRDLLPASRQSPIQVVTVPSVEQLRWSRRTCYHYTTTALRPAGGHWCLPVSRHRLEDGMCFSLKSMIQTRTENTQPANHASRLQVGLHDSLVARATHQQINEQHSVTLREEAHSGGQISNRIFSSNLKSLR